MSKILRSGHRNAQHKEAFDRNDAQVRHRRHHRRITAGFFFTSSLPHVSFHKLIVARALMLGLSVLMPNHVAYHPTQLETARRLEARWNVRYPDAGDEPLARDIPTSIQNRPPSYRSSAYET